MKQQSLSFFFKDVKEQKEEFAEHPSPKRLKVPPRPKPVTKGTVVDSMYSVPLSAISQKDLSRHVRDLTMTPMEASFGGAPVSFPAYILGPKTLSVPRFYGLQHWGPPETDNTSLGEPMGSTHFNGTLHDVQQEACSTMLARLETPEKGGVMCLPCGYGKTICALYLAASLGRRVFVLVHKNFLCEQWRERVRAFLPHCTIGKIQQNTVEADADVVIGMIQSFTKRIYPVEVMRKFGTVIIDESHHMAAPVMHRALRQVSARYIVSLSATPDRKDGLTQLLYWMMGSMCYKVERQPEKTLVSCILYNKGTRKTIKCRNDQVSLPLMLNALTEDQERNALIADRIFKVYKSGRHTIVLTDRCKQLNILFVSLQNMGVPATDMGFNIASTSKAEREETEHKPIILTTWCMSKEGLDIPRLDCLVMATPKSDIEQACGRVQRKHSEKAVPLILDIVDTFSVFEQLRWKRWSFYRNQQFTCQTYDSDAAWVPWYD